VLERSEMRVPFVLLALLSLSQACTNSPTTASTPGCLLVSHVKQSTCTVVDITGLQAATTRIYLTDDALSDANVGQVWVTISDIAVHTSANAGIDDAGWQSFPIVPAMTVDLLDLTAGSNIALLDALITPGTYQQFRMSVDSAGLVFNDGSTADVNVPSGIVRFNLGATIEAGKNYGILLDFIANSSLSESNAIWTMNPVIQVTEVFTINANGTTTAVNSI
jgi:hypothetical protein